MFCIPWVSWSRRNADVSVVLPMANSSMLVFPTITAPAAFKLSTACAEYGGTKLKRILELHVVRRSFVQILSLTATGTPASAPVIVPSSIPFCTSSAALLMHLLHPQSQNCPVSHPGRQSAPGSPAPLLLLKLLSSVSSAQAAGLSYSLSALCFLRLFT